MTPSGSPLRHLAGRYRRGLIQTAFLLTASVLILFNGTPGVAKPQEIGLSVFGALQSLLSGTGRLVAGWGNGFAELFDLQAQLGRAQAQLKTYEGNERALVQLREENARLREQLAFHQTAPFFNVPVEVVGKDPARVYSSLVISKGYLDGIRRNQAVLATLNGVTGLVGKVAEVGLTTALVQPILDANLFISARLETSRHEGLVTGKGSNEELLTMSYVKKAALPDVHVGDLVVTSGVDSLYPPDLLVGRIKSISAKEYQTSLDIDLEPVLDFSRLEVLFVLRSES